MRYLVILIGLLLLITFGLSDVVLYSKSGFERWFPLIVIFIGIPFLLHKTLTDFKVRKDISLIISIGSVLVIGPLFGLWTGVLSDKNLEKHGIITEGIVSEKWQARKHKSRDFEWLYKGEFEVLDQYYYTYSEEDIDNSVKEGDTLIIKYSKRNPENNKILGLKRIMVKTEK